jgi:DNA-binding transcriptional LysR family regulator
MKVDHKTRLALDDLLLVAALADGGSLVATAQQLGISHPTAFRRLAALERQLGARLFERSAGRYAANPAGEELARAGRVMRAEADAALLRVQGRDLQPSGLVRIASTEGVIGHLLMPLLPTLRAALPEIRLQLSARNDFHNLSRREADLALRPATEPPPHLIGQRIATLRHAIYVQRRSAQRFRGAPLASQPWLALDDSAAGSQALRWLSTLLPLDQVLLRCSGLNAVRQACCLGLGLAVLPCFIGDAEPELARLQPEPLPACDSELWLLSHAALRETARVKAVRQGLQKALQAQMPLLAGERSQAAAP